MYRRRASRREICWPSLIEHAERVDAGGRVVEREPRCQRRDVHAVHVDAVLDPALRDHPERRPVGRGRARAVPPATDLNSDADRLEPFEQLRRRDLDVVDRPAQVGDVELGVDGLQAGDHVLERGEAERAVRVPPAGLRDDALRLEPDGAAAVAGCAPFADRAGHHQVVAEELELVSQPLLQLRQVDVVLVVQEVRLQPDERLALAVEREDGVVHPEVVEVRQALRRRERPGRRRQHLVEVRRQPDACRVRHRVERAALLVIERLPDAEVVEGSVRLVRVAGGDRAVGADRHRPGQRVGDVLEERLAEAVRDRRAAAALVEEHRPVRNGLVELGEVRQAPLGEEVGVPAAHASDELAGRHGRRRAASSSWMSAMLVAFSMTTWWPGRLQRLTKCTWPSIRPGRTVRPFRSMARPWRGTPLSTSTKRPFRMTTPETTRSSPSMVWIRPLKRTSSSSPRGGGSGALADLGVANAAPGPPIPRAAPAAAPVAQELLPCDALLWLLLLRFHASSPLSRRRRRRAGPGRRRR